MAEGDSNTKLIIEALGTFGTLLAIVIGVYQFNSQQKTNLEQEQRNKKYNDAMEFKRKTWENQQTIYVSIVETVGTIASEYSSEKERNDAIAKFKVLYYGKAAFVEDSLVAASMRAFSQDIEDFKGKYLTENELKAHGLHLVDICRTSSYKSWQILSAP